MAAHVRRVESLLSPTGLWDTGFQFGDWLDPTAPPDQPAEAKADTASSPPPACTAAPRMVAETAGSSDAARTPRTSLQLAERTRAAFNEHYVSDDGTHPQRRADRRTRWRSSSACSTRRPRSWPATRLAELVAESGYRIATGFAGTPFVTDALTATGHLDDAYRLLLQRECPSWLYPVTMGATTIWERWDSMLPDGTINPGEMTSFNHYALGAVADWMHRTIGGIAPLEPGYSKVLIAPQPGGDIALGPVFSGDQARHDLRLLVPEGRRPDRAGRCCSGRCYGSGPVAKRRRAGTRQRPTQAECALSWSKRVSSTTETHLQAHSSGTV